MNLNRYVVNLYYLGTKFLFATFTFLLLFLKDVYHLDRDFLAFLASLYLSVNIFFYLRDKNIYNLKFLRFLDYFFATLLVLLAKNLYGVGPSALIVGLYSVLFLKEVSITLAVMLFLLVLKGFSSYLHMSPEEGFISAFYLFSLFFVSTKLNLLTLIKLKSQSLERLRATVAKMQREIALLSLRNRQLEEALQIVNLLGEKEKIDSLPSLLKNLLDAQEVLILKQQERLKVPVGEGFVRVALPKILFAVKPKEKFLVKDPKYREKILLVAKLLRPYMESFLAKSK